ncbi:MAG: hypothetical protein HQL18_02720, partial [Candidatus Omnitrophica bacterium]|nr:hypothetical protein [Candidatus Omnitrophota bacterium]
MKKTLLLIFFVFLSVVFFSIDLHAQNTVATDPSVQAAPSSANREGRLKRQDDALAAVLEQKKRAMEQLVLEKKATDDYLVAVKMFDRGEYENAREQFQAIDKVLPGYKKTRHFLAKINKELDKKQKELQRQEAQKQEAAKKETPKEEPPREEVRKEEPPQIQEAPKVEVAASPSAPEVVQPPAPSADNQAISDDDVLALYKSGVELFKNRDYAKAKSQFEAVSKARPDFRSTSEYLELIEGYLNLGKGKIAETVKARPAPPVRVEKKASGAVKPAPSVKVEKKAKAVAAPVMQKPAGQTAAPEKLPRRGEYEEKVAKAEPFYVKGVELYQAARYDDAKARFVQVQGILPDYKSTQEYLTLIVKAKAEASPELDERTIQLQAATLKELSLRSNNLYKEIRNLSDDRELSSSSRTFAKVNKSISQMEAANARAAQELLRQQKAAQLAASKAKAAEQEAKACAKKQLDARRDELKAQEQMKVQKEGRERQARLDKECADVKAKERSEGNKVIDKDKEIGLKAEALYQEGLVLFRKQNYTAAQDRFAGALKLRTSYKDAEQYLVRVRNAEAEHSILLLEQQDRKDIGRLGKRAEAINNDILALTEKKDFAGIQDKFSELEAVLKQIKLVKDHAKGRRVEFDSQWKNPGKPAKKDKAIKVAKPPVTGTLKDQAKRAFREGERYYSYGNYP